jgi:sporulation protein YlmC with PRC-barrel domain
MSEAQVNLGLQLLDDQLIDSNGGRCGRVDDVELRGEVGKRLRVEALLTGSGAWARRVPRPVSAVIPAVFSAWMVRIPWDVVKDVSTAVRLSQPGRELGIDTDDGREVRWVNEEVPGGLLLSALIGREARVEGGEKLGRVWDVRAERRGGDADAAGEESWEVTGILVGRAGLLQRLGIAPGERLDPPEADTRSGFVSWERVRSFEAGRIVCA